MGNFFLREIVFVFVMVVLQIVVPMAAEAALKRGYMDDEVKKVQVELLRRGYKITEADGEFGPETEAAVKLFQYQNELPSDGIVDFRTYTLLFARSGQVSESFDSRGVVIMDSAISMLGVPYVFGGNSNRRGIDCSAFTQKACRSAGIEIPRTADLQYEFGRPIKKRDIVAGDLVFFTTYEPGASHCGIYMGNDKFIHSGSSTGVTIANLSDPYWAKRYFGACRVY